MRRTMLYVTAALLCAACGDGTGPGLPPRYELATLDGQPLPAVLSVGYLPSPAPDGAEVRCELRLTDARITFGNGRRYAATSSTLRVCGDGRPDLAATTSSGGDYSLAGDTVTMLSDATQYAGSTLWQGTRSGTNLPLRQLFWPGSGSGYGDIMIDGRTYLYRVVR